VADERILVIEDEPDIAEVVRYNLDREGFRVSLCASGEEALAAARREVPDLILLDLMLPGLDGLGVFRKLKDDASLRGTPVIMLTAKDTEADIVTGLELGADDYVTKPFSMRVLLARVRTALRRQDDAPADDCSPVRHHGIEIDPVRHVVRVHDSEVTLTPTEFRLLELLARRPGWVFSRSQIVEWIHGPGHAVTDRAVDVHVAGLRKKLGETGALVETVRGVGYRMKE